MYDEYAARGGAGAPFVTDTAALLNEAIDEGKSVMFEGAQGTLLDIDHGTYPFVTSSSATAGGAVTGTGVGPTRIGTVIGVTKAYVTRVGEGPFPTEIHDAMGELLRARGQEFGAVTGRPRRCGWLDLPLLRYSNMINGTEWLVVTKMDVLDALRRDSGVHRLPDRRQGDGPDSGGCERAGAHRAGLHEAEGLADGHRGVRAFDELPKLAQEYLRFLERESGREDRHGFDRAGPRADRWRCRASAQRSTPCRRRSYLTCRT